MITESTPEKLARLQMAFAAHIRNPQEVPAPDGIEDRRMQIYRELFFNNINKFLSGNFPVLRRLYDSERWSQLVREFYIEHKAHTPMFPELPKEFLRYVQEQRQNRPGDPPFLLELAHYEWVELALSQDQTELEHIAVESNGDLLRGIPVLSPLAWPLSYTFPVHRIKPGFQPDLAPEHMTHLLVYRNRADVVKFMKLNEVTRLLLALMQEQTKLTGQQLLELTASRIGHPTPTSVVQNGLDLMQDLLRRDVLLGTRPGTGIRLIFAGIRNIMDFYDTLCSRLRAAGDYVWPLGLRLIMFWEFWESGITKLNGKNWFADIPWADWQKGFPWPFNTVSTELNWFAATWGELAFSVLILLGLFTRFAAISLIVITTVATAAVHWPAQWTSFEQLWQGYAITAQGQAGNFKLPLLFVVMLLPLVFHGGGKLSLDYVLLKLTGRHLGVNDRLGDSRALSLSFLVLAVTAVFVEPSWGITFFILAILSATIPSFAR